MFSEGFFNSHFRFVLENSIWTTFVKFTIFFEFLILRVGKILLFGRIGFLSWVERLANVPNERGKKKLKMRAG